MPRQTLRPRQLDFQPRPTFPYSPGAAGGGMVYTAGQVAWDDTGEVTGLGDVRAQTIQTLKNVKAVLEEAGATLDDVLKCNVFLKNIEDFQTFRLRCVMRVCSSRLKRSPGSGRAFSEGLAEQ